MLTEYTTIEQMKSMRYRELSDLARTFGLDLKGEPRAKIIVRIGEVQWDLIKKDTKEWRKELDERIAKTALERAEFEKSKKEVKENAKNINK